MMQPHAAPAQHALRLKIEFAQATDPGRDPNKQVNEDACGYAETKFGHLCVLCDGMGGHYGGKEASRTAITTIFEVMEQTGAHVPPAAAMKAAIEEAGRRVYRLGGPPENRARPGSTVVVMLLHDGGIDVAHVGDSRAYVVRQNQIYPLTRDHSMVQGMIDAGLLTEEQAMGHPDSNKITRALGMKPEVDVDVRPEPMELFPGDILISSSDGLTDLALGPDILGCARQGLASGGVQNACNLLVKMANDRGGHDNITVQMARIMEVGPKHTTIAGAPSPLAPKVQAPETVTMTAGGQAPSPYAPAQATPPAGPIAMPPTADWTAGAQQDLTEMGTEIMGSLPTLKDSGPTSARYGASAASGPHSGQGAPGLVQPHAAQPQAQAHAAQAQASRVVPTQNFEAFRVEAGPQSLPLPPASGYRQPGATQSGPGGAATMPYNAPFAPLAPNAGGSARGGIFFLIIGGSAAIAILMLIVLWAVLK
jgi:PPM family protein phosphatase